MIKFTDTFDSYETTFLDYSSDDSIDFNRNSQEKPIIVLDHKIDKINEKETIPLKGNLEISIKSTTQHIKEPRFQDVVENVETEKNKIATPKKLYR